MPERLMPEYRWNTVYVADSWGSSSSGYTATVSYVPSENDTLRTEILAMLAAKFPNKQFNLYVSDKPCTMGDAGTVGH
jgi:hypothetical protein